MSELHHGPRVEQRTHWGPMVIKVREQQDNQPIIKFVLRHSTTVRMAQKSGRPWLSKAKRDKLIEDDN